MTIREELAIWPHDQMRLGKEHKGCAAESCDYMSDIAVALSGARKAALIEAARTVCGPCAEGWPVTKGDRELPVIWFHPTMEDRAAHLCHASGIQALMEGL